MIITRDTQLAEISKMGEAAYPAECCGLLAGADHSRSDVRIARIVASINVTQTDTRDSFEVDSKVRFDLMQALERTEEWIVGHYHSHPDHPVEPSATGLSMRCEPDLYWLIASVNKHATDEIKAFRALPNVSEFTSVPIRIVKEKTR
jgi:proteasome lid subunit RPN8/RPN11